MKISFVNPLNTTNAMGKKRKRPKSLHRNKKNEEIILSKDLDDDNIQYMMDTKKNIKPREDLKSNFTLKHLRFKPQKYKGVFLPYHLRWIFNNNVKSNEIVLLNEIEGLENEINRLKYLKLMNRECRKLAGLPYGISTNFCQCCHLLERKNHDCSHKYCNDNCPRKKANELMNNLIKNNNKIKEINNIKANSNIPKDEDKNKENIQKNIDDKSIHKIEQNHNNSINNKITDNNVKAPPSLPKFTSIKINKNNIDSSNKTDNKVILDKSMNGKPLFISYKVNTAPAKKKLIFGTVERHIKEKKNIFLVTTDNTMGSSNSFAPTCTESTSPKLFEVKTIKNDNIEDKIKEYEIDDYSDSVSDMEIDEVFNITKLSFLLNEQNL